MGNGGYDQPEIYDLVSDDHGDDVQFFKTQVLSATGPILELACGTGRILNRIASITREGCTGLDLSQAMIETARKKAEALGLSVRYVVGDMQQFSLGEDFGFIFIPMNSLLHLRDQKSIARTFACTKKHLRGNGRFLISIFNPSDFILKRNPGERFPVMSFKDPRSQEVVNVEETTSYDEQSRISITNWYYSTGTRKDFYTHQYHLQIIYPSEMKRLISEAGFEIEGFFGDYNSKPFEDYDRLQIYSLRIR